MTPKELHGQKSHTSMGTSSQSAPLMFSVHPAGNSSVWESGFYFFFILLEKGAQSLRPGFHLGVCPFLLQEGGL